MHRNEKKTDTKTDSLGQSTSTLYAKQSDHPAIAKIKRRLQYHRMHKEKDAAASTPNPAPILNVAPAIINLKADNKWRAPPRLPLEIEYLIKLSTLNAILHLDQFSKNTDLKKIQDLTTHILENTQKYKEQFKQSLKETKLSYEKAVLTFNTNKELLDATKQGCEKLALMSQQLDKPSELSDVIQHLSDDEFTFIDYMSDTVDVMPDIISDFLESKEHRLHCYLAYNKLFRRLGTYNRIEFMYRAFTQTPFDIEDFITQTGGVRDEYIVELQKHVSRTIKFNDLMASNPAFILDLTRTLPPYQLKTWLLYSNYDFFIRQGNLLKLDIDIKNILGNDRHEWLNLWKHCDSNKTYPPGLYLTPFEKTEILTGLIEQFSFGTLIHFLHAAHCDLYKMALHDERARRNILTSEQLSATLSIKQLNELRQLPSADSKTEMKLPSLNRIKYLQNVERIQNDIIEIFKELMLHFYYNRKIIFRQLKTKEIKEIEEKIKGRLKAISENKNIINYVLQNDTYEEKFKQNRIMIMQKNIDEAQKEIENFKTEITEITFKIQHSQQDVTILHALLEKYDSLTKIIEQTEKQLDQSKDPEENMRNILQAADAIRHFLQREKKLEQKFKESSISVDNTYIPKLIKIFLKIAEFAAIDQAQLKNEKFDSKTAETYDEKSFWHIRHPILTFPQDITLNPPLPKLIHYHWFGNPLPFKYFMNIMNTCSKALDHQVILWTDNPAQVLKAVREHKIEQKKECDIFLMSLPTDNKYEKSNAAHLYLYRTADPDAKIFYYIHNNNEPQYLNDLKLAATEFKSTKNSLLKYNDQKIAEEILNVTSILGHTDNDTRFLDGIEAEKIFRSRIQILDINILLDTIKKLVRPSIYTLIIKILTEESGRTEQVAREGERGTGFKNLAFVADLTRLLSLLVLGGIYLDTDVIATENFILNQNHYGFLCVQGNNNIILTTPNHPIIHLAITDLLDQYQYMQRWGALSKQAGYTGDDSHKFSLTLHDFKRLPNLPSGAASSLTRRDLTIELGGPSGLARSIQKCASQQNLDAKSFTLASIENHIMPSSISTQHAGLKCDLISFGGIYPLSDMTWLEETQKYKSYGETQSKNETKTKGRKSFDI